MVTGAAYQDLIAEPVLGDASIRVVAATLPGFGRTAHPDDLSTESYSRMASELAGISAPTPCWVTAWEPTSRWRWRRETGTPGL